MWLRDDEVSPLERVSTLALWLALCLGAVLVALVLYRVWPA